MRADLLVMTKKGFYDQRIVKGHMLKDVLENVIQELEKMPEENEGEKMIDWTLVQINVHRDLT